MDARFWPAYASHLVFELVRIKDEPIDDNERTHVIRVLLNGKPVLSIDLDDQCVRKYLGKGPEKLMTVPDFIKLVSDLEDAGGHDYEQLLGRSSMKQGSQ